MLIYKHMDMEMSVQLRDEYLLKDLAEEKELWYLYQEFSRKIVYRKNIQKQSDYETRLKEHHWIEFFEQGRNMVKDKITAQFNINSEGEFEKWRIKTLQETTDTSIKHIICSSCPYLLSPKVDNMHGLISCGYCDYVYYLYPSCACPALLEYSGFDVLEKVMIAEKGKNAWKKWLKRYKILKE